MGDHLSCGEYEEVRSIPDNIKKKLLKEKESKKIAKYCTQKISQIFKFRNMSMSMFKIAALSAIFRPKFIFQLCSVAAYLHRSLVVIFIGKLNTKNSTVCSLESYNLGKCERHYFLELQNAKGIVIILSSNTLFVACGKNFSLGLC